MCCGIIMVSMCYFCDVSLVSFVSCPFGHSSIFLFTCLWKSLAFCLFALLVYILIIGCRSYLYILYLDISSVSYICFVNIFSQTMACLCFFCYFDVQDLLILTKSNLSIFFFFYGLCFLCLWNICQPQSCKDVLLPCILKSPL